MCLEFSFEFNSSNISLNIPWNILKSDLAFAHIYGTKRGIYKGVLDRTWYLLKFLDQLLTSGNFLCSGVG